MGDARWMRSHRILATAGAAAMSGLLLAAAVPLTSTSASAATVLTPAAAVARVKSTPVFIEGDSLTVGAKPYLRAMLKHRVGKVTIDARVGRFSGEGIAKLRSSSARHARVWVVALGTNDGPSASQTKANVRKVMRMAGSHRQVIWVNVVRPGGYGRVNRAFAQQDRAYANLTVIDWAAYIGKHRRYLGGDRVHLTDTGYRHRGAIIATSVRSVAALA